MMFTEQRLRAAAASMRPPRPSSQIRAAHPDHASQPPAARRAAEMAEAMREIFYRDGHVGEAALICEGFTAAEIIEHGDEARRLAKITMIVDGHRGDHVADFIGKARMAAVGFMPLCHATPDGDDKRAAWAAYCRAMNAHALDPWIAQSERALCRLKDFLDTGQPLLPREKNAIVGAVAGALRTANSGAAR